MTEKKRFLHIIKRKGTEKKKNNNNLLLYIYYNYIYNYSTS